MMIPCNYYINVAKRTQKYPSGIHYCRIELGDVTEEKANEQFDQLRKVFDSYIFKLRLYKVICYGKEVGKE